MSGLLPLLALALMFPPSCRVHYIDDRHYGKKVEVEFGDYIVIHFDGEFDLSMLTGNSHPGHSGKLIYKIDTPSNLTVWSLRGNVYKQHWIRIEPRRKR
jgi:hypothetical protein